MNTAETHAVREPTIESLLSGIAGGSITEGIGAVATIALAIVGLAGIYTDIVAAVATIVIGAIILMEGGLVSSAYRRLAAQGANGNQIRELGSGVTAEFFGGLAGIILGILALFGRFPPTLLAVAILVFGAAVLLGGGTVSRLSWLLQSQHQAGAQGNNGNVNVVGTGGHTLIGLATIVLGILAIIGLAPMILIQVGLLSLGAGALFSGSTMNNGAV
jgi:hypothetical protein